MSTEMRRNEIHNETIDVRKQSLEQKVISLYQSHNLQVIVQMVQTSCNNTNNIQKRIIVR